jgi:L-lactate dehydrogenase complex protein LldE
MAMPTAALFVTCLVDQIFPRVGEASVTLLEQAGFRVEFPEAQTCCGQPLHNAGHRGEARRLAQRFVEVFEPHPLVVAPSGSCASMVRVHYRELFAGDPVWASRASAVASRTFELAEILDARGFVPRHPFPGRVAYHPSCHLLRELGASGAAERLLARIPGIDLVALDDAHTCCGFGGAFSVKLPELSGAMMCDKLAAVERSRADVLAVPDAGCLAHLAGGAARRRAGLRVVHVAELLAGGV